MSADMHSPNSGAGFDNARLSLWQAASVIARRDFFAILFSRAFVFFLLGPLFPVVVGALAGSIGGQVQREVTVNTVALAMSEADNAAMMATRQSLHQTLPGLPQLESASDLSSSPEAILAQEGAGYAGVVSGSLSAPVLTGTEAQIAMWDGPIAMLSAMASGKSSTDFPEVAAKPVAASAASNRSDRLLTAQAGQLLLFMLMILLAGMVLSNLVEEKANKIIEILAASIPMDAVFLGKLIAMLGVSFVGVAVWGSFGARHIWRRSLAAIANAGFGLAAVFRAGRRLFRLWLFAARLALFDDWRDGNHCARGANLVDAGHNDAAFGVLHRSLLDHQPRFCAGTNRCGFPA
jgi:hypothetical protein